MANNAGIEVPLTGGRITPGVVRVGDTVRRPRLPTSDFVAELLIHLERRRFAGAPRYLGVDSVGRDVLTYLPGEVPARLQTFTDAQINDAGALLRGLHDATRGCHLTGPRQVVCHHDPRPNNVVFRKDRPVAFIDFDTAAPGDPLDDLGYMAWLWCWTAKHTAPPVPAQARQVRLLANAYHLDADTRRCGLVDAMLASQLRNIDFWRRRATTTDHEQADRMIAWTTNTTTPLVTATRSTWPCAGKWSAGPGLACRLVDGRRMPRTVPPPPPSMAASPLRLQFPARPHSSRSGMRTAGSSASVVWRGSDCRWVNGSSVSRRDEAGP